MTKDDPKANIEKAGYKTALMEGAVESHRAQDRLPTSSSSRLPFDNIKPYDKADIARPPMGEFVETHESQDRLPVSTSSRLPFDIEKVGIARPPKSEAVESHEAQDVSEDDNMPMMSPSDDVTASISIPSPGTHDALPAAYAVDDFDIPTGIPQAYDITNAVAESDTYKETKERNARKKYGIVVFALLVIVVIILVAVGATTGFEKQKETPYVADMDADNDDQTKSGSTEKSESSDSSDDAPPPPCPPIAPVQTYISPSETDRYCMGGYCWEQVGPVLTSLLTERNGKYLRFDSTGNRFVSSAPFAGSCNGHEIGIVRVYDINDSYNFTQVGQDIEGLEEINHAKGMLSGDGRRLAVGFSSNDGPHDIDNVGGFLVYELNQTSGNWTALGNPLYGTVKRSRFGNNLALSQTGDILAVAATHQSERTKWMGEVRVYKYRQPADDNVALHWEQMGQPILPPDDDAFMPWFGNALRLSSDGLTLVVGRENNDEIDRGADRGAVDVFRYNEEENNWITVGDQIVGLSAGDAFGRHLDISTYTSSGNGTLRIAAGCKDEYIGTNGTTTGYIRVFELDEKRNDTWIQMGSPIVGEIPGAKLNIVSLSADGTRLAAGMARVAAEGGAPGYFVVYDFIDGEWHQVGGKVDPVQSDDYKATMQLSPDGSLLLASRPEVSNGTIRLYRLVHDSSTIPESV